MGLQDLPIEILTQCFKHLSGLPDSREDLEASRLTSKRLSEIVTPILIHSVRVHISLDSLARLDEISQHPLIAKSVRTVEINLSFYDALLAKDFSLFAKCCTSDLSWDAGIFEQCPWGPDLDRSKEEEEEIEIDHAKACKAETEWTAVCKEDYDKGNLTPYQTILQEAYQEYRRRFDDQELAKRDNRHLAGIAVALRRFMGLQGIVLSDDPWKRRFSRIEKVNTTTQEKSKPDDKSSFSDAALKSRCLTASCWKGSFFTAETAPPPAQLIPDIFTALQHSSIFPSEFDISISPPIDLTVLQMSSDQLRCISHVLLKAARLSFSLGSWARKDPPATYKARPYSEIQHLGNLTRAFFDVESLKSLKLSFGDYTSSSNVPEISLGQILPLQTRTWLYLQTLTLHAIPFYQYEVRTLAERHSKTVNKLDIFTPYLLSGSWVDSVEYLRSLDKLEQVGFQHLMGGGFGHSLNYSRASRWYLNNEVAKYLLREREDNPVAEFL